MGKPSSNRFVDSLAARHPAAKNTKFPRYPTQS